VKKLLVLALCIALPGGLIYFVWLKWKKAASTVSNWSSLTLTQKLTTAIKS
jgi:hypothetical protein